MMRPKKVLSQNHIWFWLGSRHGTIADLRALADVGTDFSAATFSANHM